MSNGCDAEWALMFSLQTCAHSSFCRFIDINIGIHPSAGSFDINIGIVPTLLPWQRQWEVHAGHAERRRGRPHPTSPDHAPLQCHSSPGQ